VNDPAGNERVTMAVLSTKLDHVTQQIDTLCREYGVDHERLTVNHQRVNELERIALRPAAHCEAHRDLCNDVMTLRLDMARMAVQGGLTGGGVVTVGAGILLALGKALGWL
jgi:hypothetical protein